MNTVDVTVVGAGFNGIYTSWRLARDGISVALIDSSDQIGGVLRGKFWNSYWLDLGTHNFGMCTSQATSSTQMSYRLTQTFRRTTIEHLQLFKI